MKSLSWDDFLELRQTLPVIDVRSESEFGQGHIQNAANIPLLNDSERKIVGTTYKQAGQQQAIREGFRLVGPRLNEIIDNAEKVIAKKEAIVHCWRGGMRSSSFAQFIGMAGMKSLVLTGGYKTYRQKALESFQLPLKFISITGFTGSGKSEILRKLGELGEQIVDLEALASHKGSAFGAIKMPPQPTTEQFQNDLFERILELDVHKPVWVEDESIAIGKIFLPTDFWKTMSGSPLVKVDVSINARIERLVEDYGNCDKDTFLKALENITKKLGGQNFKAAKDFVQQGDWGRAIEIILTYYDKAYLSSIERRAEKIAIRQDWDGQDTEAIASALISSAKRKLYLK